MITHNGITLELPLPNVNIKNQTMKLYRQVSTSERMPEKDERYITNQGFVVFTNKGGYNYWFIDGEQSKVQWWLEEIEIPNEEQIDKISYKEADIEFKDEDFECPSGTCYNDWQMGFVSGCNYIISLLKG